METIIFRIFFFSAMALLFSCSFLKPFLKTEVVEEVEEKSMELVVEEGVILTGQSAHIEVDINPEVHPKCMHCSFHCPPRFPKFSDMPQTSAD